MTCLGRKAAEEDRPESREGRKTRRYRAAAA
jgi:hypothetical protein